MRFAVLGSGSSGNATIMECGRTRLLVDAGLSAKQLCLRLAELGIDPGSLSGILLTHEHGDHVRGLKNFIKKHQVPVYATRDTAHVVREQGIDGATWKIFDSGQVFRIEHLTIETFSIQHDAVDPVGFVIGNACNRFGVLSDAGHVTRSMIERLRNLSALFVEANYDDQLLANDTKRPWSIKQRISSRHGHLSNLQVEELVREIAHAEMTRLVFGHLSSDCNCPKKVVSLFKACLMELGHSHIELECARQDRVTSWFDISAPFRLLA